MEYLCGIFSFEYSIVNRIYLCLLLHAYTFFYLTFEDLQAHNDEVEYFALPFCYYLLLCYLRLCEEYNVQ